MDDNDKDVVIPVVSEELHADAVPVVTGGVRVTKRVESHDEIVQQELRKSHVEVKRVKMNRVVDGPQPVQRVGNTLIVPVVSEVLRIQKEWVVTEEIHITESQEKETVQETVTLGRENAQIERLDSAGNVTSPVNEPKEDSRPPVAANGILERRLTSKATTKRTLGGTRSLLKNRKTD